MRPLRVVVYDAPEGVDEAGWDEGWGNGIERWQVINGEVSDDRRNIDTRLFFNEELNCIPFSNTITLINSN